MVIYPDEIAAELGMTEQDKNGGVVTRAFLREAIYRSCTGLSRRQADENSGGEFCGESATRSLEANR